jgi:hypothetical protein
MASVDVRCTVSNCYFWAKSDLCSADSILITSDTQARQHPGMAFGAENGGAMVSGVGDTPAASMEMTSCHTLKAK